jgi:hypothetical protein
MRVIGVKCSLQKSIIQIERKMRGYRGKKQFTAIIQIERKRRGYRGIEQFTTIIYSKKAQNTG